MRSIQALLLAFSVPVAVIVLGAIWGHLMGWDLTQPQAVVIAALISGPFLIFAAVTAFRGQAENRREERRKFKKQMAFDREKHDAEMELDNRKFRATLKEQRRQARVEAERQRLVLEKQREDAAEAEREKQRRSQTYELITKAAIAVVDLREAFLDIPRANRDDFVTLVDAGLDPYSNTAQRPETQAAARLIQVKRADVSAVAAIFMVLRTDGPYHALMRLTNYVGDVISSPELLVEISEAQVARFGDLYVRALTSMRGIHDNPPVLGPNIGDPIP